MSSLKSNCAICGSPLIELTQKVTEKENSKFPLTTSTFKCTNKECQDEIDRKREEARQLRLERENKKANSIRAQKV